MAMRGSHLWEREKHINGFVGYKGNLSFSICLMILIDSIWVI